MSLLFVGAQSSSAAPELAATSAGFGIASLVAVPVLHVVHGNVGYGFASLGLRLVAPPLFAVLGYGVGGQISGRYDRPNCDSICVSPGASVGAVAGFVGGALGVMVLGSAVFAYDERSTIEAPAARTASASGVSWRPTFGVERGGSRVGIVGTF